MERGVSCVAGVSYLYELSGASAPGGNGMAQGNGGEMGPPGNGVAPPGGIVNPHDIVGDDNYCLRWNDYEKKYAEAFRILRDNEYFTDVTLATEGHSVKAHRVILSACSNYFHAILKSMNPWHHPVLLLQDVRAGDLNSLMDFIYFGQVQMNQDSLPSFLKIAEKLKIKGLCDSLAPVATHTPTPHAPPPPSHQHPPPTHGHAAQVVQRKEVVGISQTSVGQTSNQNFENLLPRSPYMQEPSMVPLPQSMAPRPPHSSAPPAHQSPKPIRVSSGSGGTVRQATEPLMYVSPKRTKYVAAPAMSPQSILRNQLQIAKENSVASQQQQQGSGQSATEHVEVKSEPMTILSTQEDVPSSGVNVNEFINQHENDLTLPSLSQGISPQFMFSPEPDAAGNPPGQGGVATMVTVDENNRPIRIEGSIMTTSGANVAGGVATVVNGASGIHLHGHIHPGHAVSGSALTGSQSLVQHHGTQQQHVIVTHPGGAGGSVTPGVDEPQDLTPAQDNSHSSPAPLQPHHAPHPGGQIQTPSSGQSLQQSQSLMSSTPNSASLNNSSSSTGSSPSTPNTAGTANAGAGGSGSHKKDRNSRKTCSYCHKDFHEMSLKRHIKDVHFRSQNTYVICPQCCKQYASQNSLYSHLNRVHGVKREMMNEYDVKVASDQGPVTVASSASSVGGGSTPTTTSSGSNGTSQHLVTAVRSVAPPPPPLGHFKRETVTVTNTVTGATGEIHLQIAPPGAPGSNSNDGSSNHSSPNTSTHHQNAAGQTAQHVGHPGAHHQSQQHHHSSENSHDGIMDLAQHSDNSN